MREVGYGDAKRLVRGGAILLILCGIAINRYTLAWISGDGAIESVLFNGGILLFQTSLLGAGQGLRI